MTVQERRALKRRIREAIKAAIQLSKTDWAVGIKWKISDETDLRFRGYLVRATHNENGQIFIETPVIEPHRRQTTVFLNLMADSYRLTRLSELYWHPEWAGSPLEVLARAAE